jgi:putative endonuclease
MAKSRISGAWGEALAAEYMRKKRYKLVAANYRSRFGEIDLIVENRKYLVFVEVKTRTNLACGLPRDYVTSAKQEKLRKTAACYLSQYELDCPVRFDVAEVYADSEHSAASVRIEYIENAF